MDIPIVTDLTGMVEAFYAKVDADELTVIEEVMAPEAELAFNSDPPIIGRTEIRNFVSRFKKAFDSVIHEILVMHHDPDRQTVACEVIVTYTFPDGHFVRVHAASVFAYLGEEMTSWHIFVDTSELA